MNILHVKHAVEVAKAGSLGKASEILLIATPNISRSIKELEAELGITIFERTKKGMRLTPEGEEFISYAKGILAQIDAVEKFYKEGVPKKQKFSASVPRAGYISEAFAKFSNLLSKDAAEIIYRETNSQQTIQDMLNHEYNLGIIRYAENYDKYFKTMLEEKGFRYELIAEFTYVLAMSGDNPLAGKEAITLADLADYIEIAHADPYVPTVSLPKAVKEEVPYNIERRIFIFERAVQFDLLSMNPNAFMWVSPIPDSLLERYNLVQKRCSDSKKIYKDILIYKEGYRLSRLDRQFITELCEAKRKYL